MVAMEMLYNKIAELTERLGDSDAHNSMLEQQHCSMQELLLAVQQHAQVGRTGMAVAGLGRLVGVRSVLQGPRLINGRWHQTWRWLGSRMVGLIGHL